MTGQYPDHIQADDIFISVKEEIASAITHGAGAVASLVGLVFLLLAAFSGQDTWAIVSAFVYGLSLFTLYLASTVYHSVFCPIKRDRLKSLDHCAIYLLIAGSYTPFLLVNMRDTIGWTVFGLVWGIAAVGIILKVCFRHRFKLLRVATYLMMGWIAVFCGKDFIEAIDPAGFSLLMAGGIVYSVGVIFYMMPKVPFSHAIWHLFVIGGSVCHFLAIYHYVIVPA
ncbi:PAQR family membrane homeostasis protein TrhA [Litoribrevibacter albus]|uniref:Hemolysin III family protein n=1 Tax=Litoribrevibacter albus TaxID=1473156 RepID=A0AA37W5R0_9GAMM|nr:hemolysin III family protein [Litoribrevibacter albus]GLQ29743.1 hemolysin III family protein [Litoribrevibacter albus]